MVTMKTYLARQSEYTGFQMNIWWPSLPSTVTSSGATFLIADEGFAGNYVKFTHTKAQYNAADGEYDRSNVKVTGITFRDEHLGTFVATGTFDINKIFDAYESGNMSYSVNAIMRAMLHGNDVIYGTRLSDYIIGYNGNDRLVGGGGEDRLYGHTGDDIFIGGSGWDTFNGGVGKDTFVFNFGLTAHTKYHCDRIQDFVAADDTIQIDNDFFMKAGALGTLKSTAFYKGTAAHDSNDRIIYTPATGKVYYDADGTGAGEQKLFAILKANTALYYNDFVIID